MMRRLIIAGVVLALIGAACGGDTADATTTAGNGTTDATTLGTVAPPDTAMPEAATTTEAIGPFILEGDLSARVAALQFFLSCDGYGPVPIDGSFDASTGDAVRLAQFDLGYEETGEPTRGLFAELALACDQGRSFFFPPGGTSTQSAGYVEEGHDDELGLAAAQGQTLTIDPSGGDPVAITLLAPDGGQVAETSSGTLTTTLTHGGQYTVRVSAATGPAAYVLVVTLDGGNGTQAVDTSSIVLDAEETGGLGLVDLMQPAEAVIEIMNAKLGPPATDSGENPNSGCPGIHRHVTWTIPAPDDGLTTLLTLHFHDDDGVWPEMRFTDWAYWPPEWDGSMPARPGLLTTPRGITIGSTTSEAIEAYPDLEFGMNGSTGDIMGWAGDFGLLLFASFDGDIGIDTDFGTLEGHVTAIRLPLDNCPDELTY